MNINEKLAELHLDVELEELIPRLCSSCGEVLDLNESLTVLSCPNPRCLHKLVQRGVHLSKTLGIDGVGEAFFRNFFTYLDTSFVSTILTLNPQEIEKLELDDKAFTNRLLDVAYQVEKLRPTLTPWGYLKALGVPDVAGRADTLMVGYADFSSFYSDLTLCTTMGQFAKVLGVSETSTVLIAKIVQSLGEYMADIVHYENYFDFYVPASSDVELKIVCSNSVGGGFKTKNAFYKFVDENYGDKVRVTWSSSATKTCQLLIWDGADGTPSSLTTKVKKVCGFNRTGSHIPILTAGQFIQLLDTASNGQVFLETLESLEITDWELN